MRRLVLLALASFVTFTTLASATPLTYPPAQRDDTVDDYNGVKVPAPYQWMEDLNSPAVAQWVEAENTLTQSYLDKIPERPWMQRRLKQLWNYEKVGVPQLAGKTLFFTKNSGLQNQAVIYRQSGKAKPQVVIDPNKLSPDGSVALLGWQPSVDGKYLAYGLSQGGSDWQELHVRSVATGKDTQDVVKWVKFSRISWTNDDQGFYYSRYPEPAAGEAISDRLSNQTLYYHTLGTSQDADLKIFARPDLPDWLIQGTVTDDGRYLFVYLNNGTESKNELFYADLGDPKHPKLDAEVRHLYTADDSEYTVIGNEGDMIYLQTTRWAPKRGIVRFCLCDATPVHWKPVVRESADVIEGATLSGGEVAVQYLVDAKSEIKLFGTDGSPKGQIPLPGIGTVGGLSGRIDSSQLFYGFTSYLYPTSVYRYDTKHGANSVFFKPKVPFDASKYETKQVFYTSKDGTKVPMFITARKDLKLDGSHPTILYSYGGFDINITPSFSPALPVWLELGGVYAVANLRGGGEYGEAWHEAGMLDQKQNVFDDFASAAHYLIDQQYTSTPHLGIQGYSNGGLLVGASITQNPQLFGAAYGGAGVMDMLRYQKFSGGNLWEPEYGSSDDPKAFQWLSAYSPLQNVKDGTCYPPTIITTADHDDRVVPSHSYKFAATLQHAQGCDNPVLIRVETKTSHNYMPTDKRIAQTADVWAFMAYNLGIQAAPKH